MTRVYFLAPILWLLLGACESPTAQPPPKRCWLGWLTYYDAQQVVVRVDTLFITCKGG